MESFNNKLEIGMPVMIIGSYRPENSLLIGSIVTLEAMWVVGEAVTTFFQGAAEAGVKIVAKGNGLAVVSGCKRTGQSEEGTFSMYHGWININPKYLMPLPPIEDLVIDKEKELAYDH